MFQNSLPALSNRFQCVSSRISTRRCFMASLTLRVPRSNDCRSIVFASPRQQAHKGSSPWRDCGTTTLLLLATAR